MQQQIETTSAALIPEIVPEVEPEIAVQFLIKKMLEWAVGQADGTMKLMFRPILATCSGRIDAITREEAITMIQRVHELSFDLEERTGIRNTFFDDPE